MKSTFISGLFLDTLDPLQVPSGYLQLNVNKKVNGIVLADFKNDDTIKKCAMNTISFEQRSSSGTFFAKYLENRERGQ